MATRRSMARSFGRGVKDAGVVLQQARLDESDPFEVWDYRPYGIF